MRLETVKCMKSLKYKFQKTLIAAKKQNKEKLKNTDTTFSYYCAIFLLTLSSQPIFFQKTTLGLMPLEAQGFELATKSIKGKRGFPTHLKSINSWE